jgi:hypothetical protein
MIGMSRPPKASRALALVLSFGVISSVAVLSPPGMAQRFVPGSDAEHPRVKYADSTVSINDRCAVRKTKLSRGRPVYVNSQPVGFC